MEENDYDIMSDSKQKSEADAYLTRTSGLMVDQMDDEENMKETTNNKDQIKEILGMMNKSLGQDLEALRVQLAGQHFINYDSDTDAHLQLLSPSTVEMNSTLKNENKDSIIGGDKGGSAILRKSQYDSKSEYESAIVPRKLNLKLKIHTNIDDNFEIQSSCKSSSMISRIEEDWDQFQATGETWVIICDVKDSTEQFRSTTSRISSASNLHENVSEEPTMIVHKNVPSGEMMINLDNESKQSEYSNSPAKAYKQNTKTTVINDPWFNPGQFRRVESTSSYKCLPNLQKNHNL
jgi:hypothetical protein